MLNESLPVQRDLEFEVKFNYISLISETKSHRVLIITQYLVTPPFSAILLKALSSSFRSETACLLTQSYLLSYRLQVRTVGWNLDENSPELFQTNKPITWTRRIQWTESFLFKLTVRVNSVEHGHYPLLEGRREVIIVLPLADVFQRGLKLLNCDSSVLEK